jgi:DNA-binding MarR family transcriptional regulator
MAGIASSVIPLLSQWEKYASENPEGDIPGFANWILANQQPVQAGSTIPPVQSAFAMTPAKAGAEKINPAQGAALITRNHRILDLYSKPIVKKLGFTKAIEFSAIAHVALMDHPNKKELCRQLLIENSTGVEITRRLAQKGFIAERPDPKDRRSALLSLTDKGKKILQQGVHQLSPVHNSFLDALVPAEKQQLVSLLSRIDQYHTEQINKHPDIIQ